MSRPRPVLVYAGIVAVLQAIVGYADAVNIIGPTALGWLRFLLVLIVAGGAVAVQTKVTPVADPRNNDGVPLVPDPKASRPAPNYAAGSAEPRYPSDSGY